VDLRLVPPVEIDLVRQQPDVGRKLGNRTKRRALRDLQRRGPLGRGMFRN
jgi:hypothetical protein